MTDLLLFLPEGRCLFKRTLESFSFVAGLYSKYEKIAKLGWGFLFFFFPSFFSCVFFLLFFFFFCYYFE